MHIWSDLFKHILDDPVSTVRLCVVNLTPALKQMIVLPVDRNLQTKLEGMMSKLELVEKDRDVIFALKHTLKELKTIHGMNTENLIEEKRKIEEEEKILQGKLGRSNANPHFQRLKANSKFFILKIYPFLTRYFFSTLNASKVLQLDLALSLSVFMNTIILSLEYRFLIYPEDDYRFRI